MSQIVSNSQNLNKAEKVLVSIQTRDRPEDALST